MQQEGFDPSDTVGLRKELAKRLAQAGFHQEGVMLAQETEAEELATRKTNAEIYGKAAQAQKDIIQARNDPTRAERIIATGKYDPDSVRAYMESGNPKDLKVLDERYFTFEGADGVYLQSRIDKNDRTRVDALPPKAGSQDAALRSKWEAELKDLFKNKNEDPQDVIERLQRTDPARYANLMAIGKAAVGADNVNMALQAGGDLKDAESKTWAYGMAGREGFDNLTKKWFSGTRPIPNMTKDLQNAITKAAEVTVQNDGTRGLTYTAALEMIKDPNTREYIADAMRALLPILRKDTGAAISATEWKTYFNTYIPQGGVNETDNKSRLAGLKDRLRISDTELETDPKLRRLLRNYEAKKEAETIDPDALKSKIRTLLQESGGDGDAVYNKLSRAERIVARKRNWIREQ
jgi:hypothetical protein